MLHTTEWTGDNSLIYLSGFVIDIVIDVDIVIDIENNT